MEVHKVQTKLLSDFEIHPHWKAEVPFHLVSHILCGVTFCNLHSLIVCICIYFCYLPCICVLYKCYGEAIKLYPGPIIPCAPDTEKQSPNTGILQLSTSPPSPTLASSSSPSRSSPPPTTLVSSSPLSPTLVSSSSSSSSLGQSRPMAGKA